MDGQVVLQHVLDACLDNVDGCEPRRFNFLCRYTDVHMVISEMLRRVEDCDDVGKKWDVLTLLFRYVEMITDSIYMIERWDICDLFTKLLQVTPKPNSTNRVVQMCNTLRIMIMAIPSISSSLILRKMTSSGTERMLPALYAVSTVRKGMVTHVVQALNHKSYVLIEFVTILRMFMLDNNVSSLGQPALSLLVSEQFASKECEVFKLCVGDKDEAMVLAGFQMLESVFGFASEADALGLCEMCAESFVGAVRSASVDVLAMAMRALRAVPESNGHGSSFGVMKQIMTFVPVFANHISKFTSGIGSELLEFLDARKNAIEFKEALVKALRDVTSFVGLVLIAAQHDLIENVKHSIFCDSFTDAKTAAMTCLSICHIHKNERLTLSLIPNATAVVLEAMRHSQIESESALALQAVCEASLSNPFLLLSSLMAHIDLVKDRNYTGGLVPVLITGCTMYKNVDVSGDGYEYLAERFYGFLSTYILEDRGSGVVTLCGIMCAICSACATGSMASMELIQGYSAASICAELLSGKFRDLVDGLASKRIYKDPAAIVVHILLCRESALNASPLRERKTRPRMETFKDNVLRQFFQAVSTFDVATAISGLMETFSRKRKSFISRWIYFIYGSYDIPRTLVHDIIALLAECKLSTEDRSLLYDILDKVIECDRKSLSIILEMSKTRAEAKLNHTLVKKIMVPFFVSAIPNIVCVMNADETKLLAAAEIVYLHGHEKTCIALCENAIKCAAGRGYHVLVDFALKKDRDERLCEFVMYLSSKGSVTECANLVDLVVKVASDLLSECVRVREWVRRAVASVFLSEEPKIRNDVIIYGERLAGTVCLFHSVATSLTPGIVDVVSAAIMNVIDTISVSQAIFMCEVVKAHVAKKPELLDHLFHAKMESDRDVTHVVVDCIRDIFHENQENNADRVLAKFIEHRIPTHLASLVSDFIRVDGDREKLMKYMVAAVQSDGFKTSGVSDRCDLLTSVCQLNHDKKTDFLLFWVILAILGRHGDVSEFAPVINRHFDAVLSRLGIRFSQLSSMKLHASCAQSVLKLVLDLGSSDLYTLITMRRSVILERDPKPRVISIFFLFLVQIVQTFHIMDKTLAREASKDLAYLLSIGSHNNELVRLISTHMVKSFDDKAWELFGEEELKKLIRVGWKMLTPPDPNTCRDNVRFISKVLVISPRELTASSEKKLAEALTNSLAFVKIDDVMDAIKAVMTCGTNIEEFNTMSEISIQRMLILLADENPTLRLKALSILSSLTGGDDSSSVMRRLVDSLGFHDVLTSTKIFINWMSKTAITVRSLSCLRDMVASLQDDQSCRQYLVATLTQLLAPILDDTTHTCWYVALDITTSLLA